MFSKRAISLQSGSAVIAIGVALCAGSAMAQTSESVASSGDIIVTGSRIARPNLEANSPVAVVTGEAAVANADITLDTFLNTLPQVNPAGTTTSNNPGNGGQSNINLRGLGSNRNLVLINGRRPMVSASDQTVDLNTIPQGLIERIDVTTGGAGGAYGADAIAGVVNLVLKRDFQGLDLRATYSNSIPQTDAREYQISGTIGGNFADGRGNVTFSAEYAKRQGMIKAQRPFAAQATSTTSSSPTGTLLNSAGNPFSQADVDALFAGYGVAAAQIPRVNQLAFNSDGSLFGVGTFNSPVDVSNFRYPLSSAANPNLNYFPDFYSYNFDIVNILTLPLERKSAFVTGRYEISPAAEFFVQGGYTNYNSATALAPTPVSTGIVNSLNTAAGIANARSPLVQAGTVCGTLAAPTTCRITGFVVPVTNPFISADLAGLLAGRTGNDDALTGSGATEALRIGYRFLGTGLRESQTENEVIQGLIGLRGEIATGWNYEAYYSYGQTTIDNKATGNVNVQKVQALLEAADGGLSLCEGGFNPFGIQPLSAACVAYVAETGQTRTRFTQNIAQAFVTGELTDLPGGPLGVVLGVESRKFKYDFDPGALFGPIAGFNTSTPDLGTNSFLDIFGELRAPITDTAEVSFTARHSRSDFNDEYNGIDGDPVKSWAYGVNASWAPVPEVRVRGSYQRSVRAPNFGELFSGGGSFPQIFDPCSVTSNFRQNGGAAASNLCAATGVSAGTLNTFVATPGAQAFLGGTGNTDLKPEKADTFTGGLVFNAGGFTGSVDYYNIRIKDTIYNPDVNELIASCYGYNDINPSLDENSPYCGSLARSGNNIAALYLPASLGGDADGYFRATNQGTVKTSGIDVQLGYRLPTEFINQDSGLSLNLMVNYLIDYKVGGLGGLSTDYAGTASFFGVALGSTFPEWRATLNSKLNLTKELAFDTRIRFLDGMENRASRIYKGEEFTGPGSVWYFDFALEANVEALTFRVGLNNAFNRQPPTYSPNVQSGTDPSVYDVIGRRGYVSARLRF
jgi:iron complex outermembrane receptor protein